MSEQVVSDLRVIADWWKGRLNDGSVREVETTPEVRDALTRFAGEMPGFADAMNCRVKRPKDYLIFRMLDHSWHSKKTEHMRSSEIKKVLEVFFDTEDIERVVGEICSKGGLEV